MTLARLLLLPFMLMLAGCATHTLERTDALSKFVGDRVAIEGYVVDESVYVPGKPGSSGWCLTLRQDWKLPKNELTLTNGTAVVIFDTDRGDDTPRVGQNVRVTGKLGIVQREVGASPEDVYIIENAKWEIQE